jgi:hypothetical protein
MGRVLAFPIAGNHAPFGDKTMKTAAIILALFTFGTYAASPALAGSNCNTTCYGYGNYRNCTTHCY